jgi:hypoxanthine phosphoribosyltransferase
LRVVTLGPTEFETSCEQLCCLVMKDGYVPTHVVTIASGGTKVGSAFRRLLSPSTAFIDVSLSRYSAPTKALTRQRGLNSRLPYWITDQLRRIEHWLRSMAFDEKRAHEKVRSSRPAWTGLDAIGPNARALIVDDAVDSGVTLAIAMNALRAHSRAGTEVRSAVLATTWRRPLVKPTYSLYSGILCRFPWSNDFHA